MPRKMKEPVRQFRHPAGIIVGKRLYKLICDFTGCASYARTVQGNSFWRSARNILYSYSQQMKYLGIPSSVENNGRNPISYWAFNGKITEARKIIKELVKEFDNVPDQDMKMYPVLSKIQTELKVLLKISEE